MTSLLFNSLNFNLLTQILPKDSLLKVQLARNTLIVKQKQKI